jgi:excisionase family DNA binding protein
MVTVPEAARLYRKHPETIRRWIREGKLRATKIGTQHFIDEDDLGSLVGSPPPGGSEAVTVASMPDVAAEIRRTRGERSARVAESVAPYASGLAAPPHPPERGDAWLPAIVGRIVRLVDPAKIVLFGSRARGDFRDDSDYDLLVVLDEVGDRRTTRIAIRGALDDLPISKDVVVVTSADAAGVRGRPRGVLYWALAEGRVVYERI